MDDSRMVPAEFGEGASVSRPLLGGVGSDPLADLLTGADAESLLVEGLLRHMLRMNRGAMRAALFMMTYGLQDECAFVLKLRAHQSSSKELRQALESVSLKKFMAKIDVVLGNK